MESSARRVTIAVDELARSLGGRARAARLIGRGQRYLDDPMRLRLGTWEHTLGVWGVDPLRMAAWTHAVHRFEHMGAVEQVCADAAALAKRRTEPASAQALRLAYLRGTLDERPSTMEELAQLAKLDELHYTNPSLAVRRAERMATSATSAETAARALCCWASALRLVRTQPRALPARLRRGHVLLWMALRMAAAARCELAVADGLQRLVFVTADRTSDLDQGVRLARAMVMIYERQGPEFQDSRGRSFVTLGSVLYKAGNSVDAALAFARGVDLLSVESTHYRAATFQHLAFIAAEGGDLATAKHWADHLSSYQVDDSLRLARILWLRARLAVGTGDLQEAQILYRSTLDQFGTRYPFDSALAGVEFVRVLVKSGQIEDACSLARGLAWTVAPFEAEIPAAAAALADLVLVSQTAARRGPLLAITRRLIDAIGERGPFAISE